MRTVRSFPFPRLALLALIALSGQAFAASNTAVGLCSASGIHYTTIQAAVNAVELLNSLPRTVRVCPGNYTEQVSITASLTLEGVASGTTAAAVVLPPAWRKTVSTFLATR